MTPAERGPWLRTVRRWVRHYRPALGIDPRLKIKVDWEDDLEVYAKAYQNPNRPYAFITIGEMFFEQNHRDRLQTVIHELLHLAAWSPHHTICHGLETIDSKASFLLYQQYVSASELYVDTLAEALVDRLERP